MTKSISNEPQKNCGWEYIKVKIICLFKACKIIPNQFKLICWLYFKKNFKNFQD